MVVVLLLLLVLLWLLLCPITVVTIVMWCECSWTVFEALLKEKCHCYRLSKQPNCFCGTCSGLGTWRPRCTRGASSGTRHVIPLPSLSPIALVTAPLSGAASPMTPALSMTHASALVPVPFPQLSPHVLKVSSNHSQSLRFGSAGDRRLISSYCLVSPRVPLPRIIVSTYTIFWDRLLFYGYRLVYRPYLGPFSFAYIRWLWVA